MKSTPQIQESLFPDLPAALGEEEFERRILAEAWKKTIEFTRQKIMEMGPAVEFVAAVWVADDRVEEICVNLKSLNFLHAEKTARRTLEILHDRGIQAALKINGHDWEELAEQTENVLKKIKTTRRDGCTRAAGGGRKKKKGGKK